MTTEQYWASIDALASARGTDRLLEAAELLRANPPSPCSSPAVTPMDASCICLHHLMRGILMQPATVT